MKLSVTDFSSEKNSGKNNKLYFVVIVCEINFAKSLGIFFSTMYACSMCNVRNYLLR
jgi:hypothetical protein